MAMILKINIKPVLPFAHVRILIDRHIAVHVQIVHYSDPPPPMPYAPAYQRMDKTRHFVPYSVQKEYLFNSTVKQRQLEHGAKRRLELITPRLLSS